MISKSLFTEEYFSLEVKTEDPDLLIKEVEQTKEELNILQYLEISTEDFNSQYIFIKDVYDF